MLFGFGLKVKSELLTITISLLIMILDPGFESLAMISSSYFRGDIKSTDEH